MENTTTPANIVTLPLLDSLPEMPRTLPIPSTESFAAASKAAKQKAALRNGLGRTARRRIGKIHKRAIRKPGMKFGRWDASEHRRFLEAMERFGNSWKLVCNHIRTRTADQIRSHAQKYYEGIKSRLIKEMKEDPERKKSIFVVTREYWNTNGLSRGSNSTAATVGPNKEHAKAKAETSAEKSLLSPAKEAKSERSKGGSVSAQMETSPKAGQQQQQSNPQVIKSTPLYPSLSMQLQSKFPLDPAWLMLAQSCAYANSMLLNNLKQYASSSPLTHNS